MSYTKTFQRRDISDQAVVEACRDSHSGRERPRRSADAIVSCFHGQPIPRCKASWEILAERFPGAPEKVIYAAMDRAFDRGLIDYGVSLRTAWPTDAGLALLNAVSKVMS